MPAAPPYLLLPPQCPLLPQECYRDDVRWVLHHPTSHTEVQAIATDKVKFQLEEKENNKYPHFQGHGVQEPARHREYFIKFQVEDDDLVHIRGFESLPHENKPLALHSYQINKIKHDELIYF